MSSYYFVLLLRKTVFGRLGVMKLSGTVEVSNRLLPSLNVKNKRPQRSYLSVGSLPGKEGAPFILLQTVTNGAGIKYKVQGNIQAVFTKFISDGKATIRFTNPPHDLIIKSDPDKLKHFLKILKHSLEGKQVHLSYLTGAPAKVSPKPKTKLIISSKQDFPVLSGYPRGLEYLQVNNVGLKKIEGGILRLQNLKILNLSDNEIDSLPPQLDLLPNLIELHLGRNNLGTGKDWRWMYSKTIQEKINLLDLSSNKISNLPNCITRFKSIRNINLSNNNLTALPNRFGLLSTLRILDLSQNSIEYLPSSFRFIHLDSLDLCMNDSTGPPLNPQFGQAQEPTLVDRSALVVLSKRLPFNRKTIPWTLVDYLENANYCVCGKPVLPSGVITVIPFNLRQISLSVSFMPLSNPSIGISFCSTRCRLTVSSFNIPIF